MGQKDITEKHLQEYNDVFADIVNILLFGGRSIVREEDLENGLTKSQYKADNGKIHEQERDVSKFWKEGSVNIVLYGLENQTLVDKDIPLRVIGYDGQSYRSQMLDKSNDGRRFPIVTLVLYFGTKHWNGPRSLHEALQIPTYLQPYVSDYKINVCEVAFLEPEQVQMFKSDFKYVADYFVQMRTKKDYVPSKETMEHVDAVLKIMSVLTGDDRFEQVQNSGTEVKSMCEALDKVEKRGIEQGIEQGIERGIEQGINALVNTLKRLGIPDDVIILNVMKEFGISEGKARSYV